MRFFICNLYRSYGDEEGHVKMMYNMSWLYSKNMLNL